MEYIIWRAGNLWVKERWAGSHCDTCIKSSIRCMFTKLEEKWSLLEVFREFWKITIVGPSSIEAFCSSVYSFAQRRHWRFSQCFYGISRGGHFLLYQKHCRRHREFYCCLCCWCFRRAKLWISANICVCHVRYCYLFDVVYFFSLYTQKLQN